MCLPKGHGFAEGDRRQVVREYVKTLAIAQAYGQAWLGQDITQPEGFRMPDKSTRPLQHLLEHFKS
eukprot:6078746-Prorocentrum_lima.AAC.1